MRILYGVQATGNGHITRARAMSSHFKQAGIEVDYLFSGRDRDQFFDMDEFGDWRCMEGLTFVHKSGSVKLLATIRKNNIFQLIKDIKHLDLTGYDLVLTDFEPITAWAAKFKKIFCLGMGHQYAFYHDVPRRGESFAAKLIMRNFAPVSMGLGLHWHHFGQPILPPIAQVHKTSQAVDKNKIIVYLGFEDPQEVLDLLKPITDYQFIIYCAADKPSTKGHIQIKPLSRDGFKEDLAVASGVICNAGFELSSEAIQLGKKLLVKPLKGQMEQLSNARALERLGLALTMNSLDKNRVRYWLDEFNSSQVVYPDVAEAIVQWITDGEWQDISDLVKRLWAAVEGDFAYEMKNSEIEAFLS